MTPPKIEIQQLFAAGVHFGHFRRRWHPKMAPYIHSFSGRRCIIDLEYTKSSLQEALTFIVNLVAQGEQIIFIGTKKQAQPIILEAAQKTQMPYVINRWIGGMLTNHATINLQIQKLKDLEARLHSGELAHHHSKLEVANFKKQIDQLNFLYGGCKELKGLPGALFVNDVIANAIAVTEARKLKIPVVAMVDTNVNPSLVTHPIFANDDAISSIKMIVDLVSSAIVRGQGAAVKPEQVTESPPVKTETKEVSDAQS